MPTMVRGCGERVKGGIYSVSKLQPYGLPLEYFIVDPPAPIDLQAIGLSSIGVKLLQVGDAWHIFDWIGMGNYLNVCDFLEEVRQFGLSRRVPRTLDYSKITSKSRHICVHARCFIKNWREYIEARERPIRAWMDQSPECGFSCPKQTLIGKYGSLADNQLWSAQAEMHQGIPVGGTAEYDRATPCSSLWWEDIEGGTTNEWTIGRSVTRTMPSFTYSGRANPRHTIPEYEPGIIASFPISGFEIVRDEAGVESQIKAVQKADRQFTLVEA